MEKIREKYEAAFGKKVPNNKKNDKDWIISKVDEFLENGDKEACVPCQAAKKKACKPCKKAKTDIPQDVQELADKLEKEAGIGSYYSGEWKFEVKRDGVSIKKA